MHDPMTVAFDAHPLLVIWHKDPERLGNDDSCDWSGGHHPGRPWPLHPRFHFHHWRIQLPWIQLPQEVGVFAVLRVRRSVPVERGARSAWWMQFGAAMVSGRGPHSARGLPESDSVSVAPAEKDAFNERAGGETVKDEIAEKRKVREEERGAEMHAEGVAFAFELYEHDDDGVGTIDTGEVVVMTHPEALSGLRMSPDHALRLARDLIQAVLGPEEQVEPVLEVRP